jgi:hypothetical protein
MDPEYFLLYGLNGFDLIACRQYHPHTFYMFSKIIMQFMYAVLCMFCLLLPSSKSHRFYQPLPTIAHKQGNDFIEVS